METIKLYSTAVEGDHFPIQSHQACHDLGNGYCRQTCIQEGEVAKEVVHGGAEMRVRAHSKENEEIASHSDAVDEEEEEEEEARVLSCVHQTL